LITATNFLLLACKLLPVALMIAAIPHQRGAVVPPAWARFRGLAIAALCNTVLSLVLQLAAVPGFAGPLLPGLAATLAGAWVAVLVQLLGLVIGAFSSRYLQGEPGQPRYVAALGGVLAAVHLLLLADHWLVLIAAWAAVGVALQHLLCFYAGRPFALLAAYKKRLADRLADVLLIVAAALAWSEVGSGSLPALWRHLEASVPSAALQASAVCLALAVVLRTALLPVHGWLIQVMEAPTPVSALLHAGVINLGGFVLVRFAPLLDAAPVARWLLEGMGLVTALLAGLVMLTRISIKVRLAWSTVAQMGFMTMECSLGLYKLALLHLIGHSLYKAHAFLSASTAVEATRLRIMRGTVAPSAVSLVVAPIVTATLIASLIAVLVAIVPRAAAGAWPWWWTGVLAMAWAPLLWLPSKRHPDAPGALQQVLAGAGMVAALVLAAWVGHALPLGARDAPDAATGAVALAGMAALYLCVALLQARPQALGRWRRWSYAGFYVDEYATRAALRLWPARWTPTIAPEPIEEPPMDTLTTPRTEPPGRPQPITLTSGSNPMTGIATATESEIDLRIDTACAAACSAIAPAWPLDRAIAVNPHWERIGMPVRTVAARMAMLGDIAVFPPRSQLRQAWASGRIAAADLDEALAQCTAARTAGLDAARAVAALAQQSALSRLPLLIDVLDDDPQGRHRLSWRQAITHQVSQVCAAFFDEHQADWQPNRAGGLYTFWRDTLTHDHGIGVLMGLPDIARGLTALPATREDAERWVLRRLGLPEQAWADYLEAVLLTVNGWASWCAYLAWEAHLHGKTDAHLRDLLAIRLAWGAILLECRDDGATQRALSELQVQWARSPSLLQQAEAALLVDEVWQLAFEVGYQRGLAQRLRAVAPLASPAGAIEAAQDVEVQAAFCIDVRSEPLRRAIESVWPAVQTIGFAGFFGLPVAYTPLATEARRPQLPGLLAPALEVTERVADTIADFGSNGDALQSSARQARLNSFTRTDQWGASSRWPNAAFSSVEAVGVSYMGRLARWLRPSPTARHSLDGAGLSPRYRPVCRPLLAGLDRNAKVDLAAGVLHALGLDRGIARLVVLVGHGSQSANNAQAAALDCGACCGQTGEVNARVLARLLNETEVQAGLLARGITLPAEASFVAALHNTTTDEIEGFDLDLLDDAARKRWAGLQSVFAHACDQVRRERAVALGLDPRSPHADLLDQLRRRANDGAQTRPEWGLAGNAAFVIAPRVRTLGAVLEGRAFLHDYDATNDADGCVLELLITAPMLVAHWINWQYHASTCDPQRLGSGNKLLHNVVGGRIGVFEGNGGDLRIGLARQSLHDGAQWRHEPLRLTVVIDAPAEAIERVIAKHRVVRQLLDNNWLHLWRFTDDGHHMRYALGHWETGMA
jgi:uncharacterized protein YbcC (UPF0753/DUF2309 family)